MYNDGKMNHLGVSAVVQVWNQLYKSSTRYKLCAFVRFSCYDVSYGDNKRTCYLFCNEKAASSSYFFVSFAAS